MRCKDSLGKLTKHLIFFVQMAEEKAVSTATKPQMRGLLNSSIKRNLYVSLVFAGIVGFAFKQFIGTERKKRYAEFYR